VKETDTHAPPPRRNRPSLNAALLLVAADLDPAVVAAFDGVQQQAKDVCHTPMSI